MPANWSDFTAKNLDITDPDFRRLRACFDDMPKRRDLMVMASAAEPESVMTMPETEEASANVQSTLN
jgi:hypothetical protein